MHQNIHPCFEFCTLLRGWGRGGRKATNSYIRKSQHNTSYLLTFFFNFPYLIRWLRRARMIILIEVGRCFVTLDPALHATLGGALCIGVGLWLVEDLVVYRERGALGRRRTAHSFPTAHCFSISNASSRLVGPIRPAEIQYANLPMFFLMLLLTLI